MSSGNGVVVTWSVRFVGRVFESMNHEPVLI